MFLDCEYKEKTQVLYRSFHSQEYASPDCVHTLKSAILWQRCRCSQFEKTEYTWSLLINQRWIKLCSLCSSNWACVVHIQAVQTSCLPTLPTVQSLWRPDGFPSGVLRLFNQPHKLTASLMRGGFVFALFVITRAHCNWTNMAVLQKSVVQFRKLAAEDVPSSETKSEVIPIQATLIAKKCLLKSPKQFGFSEDLKLIFRKKVVLLPKDRISPVFYFYVKLFHF